MLSHRSSTTPRVKSTRRSFPPRRHARSLDGNLSMTLNGVYRRRSNGTVVSWGEIGKKAVDRKVGIRKRDSTQSRIGCGLTLEDLHDQKYSRCYRAARSR